MNEEQAIVEQTEPEVQETEEPQQTLADKEGLPAFDASKYGLSDDFGSETEETEELDEIVDQEEPPKGDDEPFVLDGIDLSNIPKELRRETLKETIEAINEAKTAKDAEIEKAQNELNSVKNLLKEEGYKDSFVAQYHKNIKALDAEISVKTKEARDFLQREVDAGRMSEADANAEYGSYKTELKHIKEEHVKDSYSKTNLAIVENFIKNNEEVLKTPVISEAAQALLTDIIQDGNIVDTERSMNYLSLGKKIYDEAFKAGLAASKQATENKKLDDLKKQVSNPQAKKGASSPQKRGIPYASASEVPTKVWNENAEIRNYFLKKEVSDGTFGIR